MKTLFSSLKNNNKRAFVNKVLHYKVSSYEKVLQIKKFLKIEKSNLNIFLIYITIKVVFCETSKRTKRKKLFVS